MKSLLLALTLIASLSIGAQVPLIDKYGNITDGAYYQDVDNDLGKLEGTWLYTNGDEQFKITLQKKTYSLVTSTVRNISYYQDVLYGEYQYINSDGQLVNNSLIDIGVFNDVSQHLVYGNYIKIAGEYPVCEDCDPSERLVKVSIEDPEREYFDYNMWIRHIPASASNNNSEQILIHIRPEHMMFYPEGSPNNHRLPVYGDIILNKIN